ncbi:MAG: serine/threonine protein phosphatase [Clostridia bacterium]|nr:serine/threonine protein phosphatase [Clostridia bacterium]
MSLYVIGDLHLAFNENKPMNIFGDNWQNHDKKIKQDWKSKVKDEDTVLLVGDFSWSMHLKDTIKDFEYLNNLPGKKILLKGNHDYWWTTVTNMKNFLIENNFKNIDFLHNNCFLIEDKIICGTRGWALNTEETEDYRKIIARECNRLKLSIEEGMKKYGEDKEIIVCMHYPPITNINIIKNESTPFMELMKEFNVKRCFYGHLHGKSIEEAVEGNVDGIELKLVSCDGVDFKLVKIW